MNKLYLDLNYEIQKMNAATSVYDEILHNIASSEMERENILLKLELVKNEILKSNMAIKKMLLEIESEKNN